ncbi:CPBP family intramembrane glutamic endopeptidase [Roseateles puraquae]|nr:CPBP family intramembrane glutamic endopeptidase [Roseateles puraquae]
MPQPRDTFPNAFEAAFMVAFLFVLEFVIGSALYDARSLLGIPVDDLMSLALVLGNGVLITTTLQLTQLSYGQLLHPSSQSPQAVMGLLALPLLCLLPGLYVAMGVVDMLVVAVFPMSTADVAMFDRMSAHTPITVLMVCVIAPLVEEMLFRGLILRSFLRQYPRGHAILGSALLFGAAHLNVYQFAAGTLIGLLLGWLYERTRSLWPCMALHAAYNLSVTWGDGLQALSSLQWGLALVLPVFGIVMLGRLLPPPRD